MSQEAKQTLKPLTREQFQLLLNYVTYVTHGPVSSTDPVSVRLRQSARELAALYLEAWDRGSYDFISLDCLQRHATIKAKALNGDHLSDSEVDQAFWMGAIAASFLPYADDTRRCMEGIIAGDLENETTAKELLKSVTRSEVRDV